MSLIDWKYLKFYLPNYRISQFSQPITVKKIENHCHPCYKYDALDSYITRKNNQSIAVTHLQHKIHIFDNLKAKLLIEIDVFGLEKVVILINRQKIQIFQCE